MAKLRKRTRSKAGNSATASGRRSRSRKTRILGAKPALQFEWVSAISDEQWQVYRCAIHALQSAGLRIMLGGGFAMASYTGRWRNTKDIDFYVLREDREKAIAALSAAGFSDYYNQLPYDRNWIYRSTQSGMIVDVIWAMANQRAQVDDEWFKNAAEISIRGEPLSVVPVEEFIWCKLYILQRDHCDWTDVLNVLFAAGTEVDWKRLLGRLEEDWPLLKALLTLYGWVCPRQAARLPAELYRRLRLAAPEIPRNTRFNRIRLLDSRDWFAALLERNQPLAV